MVVIPVVQAFAMGYRVLCARLDRFNALLIQLLCRDSVFEIPVVVFGGDFCKSHREYCVHLKMVEPHRRSRHNVAQPSDSHAVRPWHRSKKLKEKQANGDRSHDAERPVVIWGVSCPDH